MIQTMEILILSFLLVFHVSSVHPMLRAILTVLISMPLFTLEGSLGSNETIKLFKKKILIQTFVFPYKSLSPL